MTHNILKEIITLCRWAPSGDNCQPWHMTWDDQVLTVDLNAKLAQHALNKNFMSSAIYMGGLYTYLEIASARFGYLTKIINKNILSSGEMQLKIIFEKTDITNSDLFNALKTRHTDRRNYNGKPLAPAVLKKIEALNKPSLSSKVYCKSPPQDDVLNYISRSDHFLWSALPQAVTDLLNWIHFSRKEEKLSKRGMHWGCLAAPLPAVFTLYLMKKLNIFKILFSPLLATVAPHISRLQIRSSGALLLFTVTEPTLNAVFDCGRLSTLAWLYLESKGLSSQPITLASMQLLNQKLDPHFFSNNLKAKTHFSKGPELLRSHFNFTKEECPAWMFRVGYVDQKYPDNMRTLRCDIEELLTIVPRA